MHTRITVKAVIFDEHDNVLLLQRSRFDERRAGEQDFPGGGLEPDEDIAAGLSREIYEEAGIGVHWRKLKLFYTYTEAYKDTNIVRLVYWARIEKPLVVLSEEHEQFKWVPAAEVSAEFPHPVFGVAVDYGLTYKLFN